MCAPRVFDGAGCEEKGVTKRPIDKRGFVTQFELLVPPQSVFQSRRQHLDDVRDPARSISSCRSGANLRDDKFVARPGSVVERPEVLGSIRRAAASGWARPRLPLDPIYEMVVLIVWVTTSARISDRTSDRCSSPRSWC